MNNKKHQVYIFYSLLTWYLLPFIYTKIGREEKEEAFVVGFIISMILYINYGKYYIN